MTTTFDKENIESAMRSERLIPAHDKTFNLLHYKTGQPASIVTEEDLALQIEFNEKPPVRRHAEVLLNNLRDWAYKNGYR